MHGKSVPLIRQMGTTDCGIACLTMLFQYYGFNIDISEMKARIKIGRNGVSLAKMRDIAEEYGFSFKAYSDYLEEQNLLSNLPVIMCSKENHFVVVSERKHGKYVVLDPVKGKLKMNYADIQNAFLNILVLIRPSGNISYNKIKSDFQVPVNKTKFVIAILLTFIAQSIVLVPSLVIQNIVNAISYNEHDFAIIKYIIVAFLIAVLFFGVNLVKKKILLLLQNEIYEDTIFLMIDKIFNIDLSYFESHSSGDVESRFNSINDIYEFVSGALITTTVDVITAVFCGILMITQSSSLFLLIMILTVIQILIVVLLNRKARVKTKNYIADQSILEARMIEILTNIQQIRCMRIENLLCSSIKDDYTHLISRLKDRIKISDLMESIIGAFSMLSSILLYAVGGLLVFRGKIKLGTLISFATLAGHFTGPFQTLSLVAPQFNVLKETLIRLKELMNYQSDYENGNERIEHFESIDLVKVTYSYLGSAEPDIENITLEINKGEKVAIVGSSGGGKTTIIKLLLNVFSNYDGEILLNKKNIKNILKEDVDRIFAIVTQVPMAMNGTIKENIDLTNSLSEEEIYSCLEMVELREDIEKFPLKLNTYVGENGQNISGGQKQRIAIARALALKPEVIIFDEATSNLDPITEKKICDNLKKLHITQIVITHRLSAVEDADKIYVIDKGKISEFGTYAQLIKVKEGYFAAANK
ncbi:peptidase domain-containing ABC transporter [Blautia wexlerae]|uniref:peptidase domain-containing ABC transporter n=1 Tax=Blautia wexlerae TaxID=418240 RepID=UPI00321B247F